MFLRVLFFCLLMLRGCDVVYAGVPDYGEVIGRYVSGDRGGALLMLDAAVSGDSGNWLWWYRRGEVRLWMGDLMGARGDLDMAAELNPRLRIRGEWCGLWSRAGGV